MYVEMWFGTKMYPQDFYGGLTVYVIITYFLNVVKSTCFPNEGNNPRFAGL